MARLRAPGGCPWDREQTFDTIKRYTLEETYEVLEAIDNRDWKELTGELGDLLLQVLFYAEMAEEQGSFTIDDVLDTLSNKLIHRHPHVFGEVKANDSAQVLKNWEALKAEEKRKSLQSSGEYLQTGPQLLLDGVSSKMPALQEAHKISSKAAHVGFDWPQVQGLFEKLSEETRELQEHIQHLPSGNLNSPESRAFPRSCRNAWKMRSAISFLSWSTSRAIFPSTRNPLCARPTGNSGGALAGWKSSCAGRAERWKKPRWMKWKLYGNRPRSWRKQNLERHPLRDGTDHDQKM